MYMNELLSFIKTPTLDMSHSFTYKGWVLIDDHHSFIYISRVGALIDDHHSFIHISNVATLVCK
jgi:hypothetical protein